MAFKMKGSSFYGKNGKSPLKQETMRREARALPREEIVERDTLTRRPERPKRVNEVAKEFPQMTTLDESPRSRTRMKGSKTKPRLNAEGRPLGPRLSKEQIAKITSSEAYKDFDKSGSEEKFTSKEHESNKAGNAAIDQQILDYRKAYYDKHGSSSGGSETEWKAKEEGLKKLRTGYINR